MLPECPSRTTSVSNTEHEKHSNYGISTICRPGIMWMAYIFNGCTQAVEAVFVFMTGLLTNQLALDKVRDYGAHKQATVNQRSESLSREKEPCRGTTCFPFSKYGQPTTVDSIFFFFFDVPQPQPPWTMPWHGPLPGLPLPLGWRQALLGCLRQKNAP